MLISKWPPGSHIGVLGFRTNFSLALNINSKLQWQNTYQWPHYLNACLVAILDFSVYGWHGFGSVTQVCFGISVSNFMFMSFVAVGRSLTIVSYVAFKMVALWFWTMFNCNPPIAHCHPLLWGGGILVDHWSSISSSSRNKLYWLHQMPVTVICQYSLTKTYVHCSRVLCCTSLPIVYPYPSRLLHSHRPNGSEVALRRI